MISFCSRKGRRQRNRCTGAKQIFYLFLSTVTNFALSSLPSSGLPLRSVYQADKIHDLLSGSRLGPHPHSTAALQNEQIEDQSISSSADEQNFCHVTYRVACFIDESLLFMVGVSDFHGRINRHLLHSSPRQTGSYIADLLQYTCFFFCFSGIKASPYDGRIRRQHRRRVPVQQHGEEVGC